MYTLIRFEQGACAVPIQRRRRSDHKSVSYVFRARVPKHRARLGPSGRQARLRGQSSLLIDNLLVNRLEGVSRANQQTLRGDASENGDVDKAGSLAWNGRDMLT